MRIIILRIITFLSFFYHIYPQALDMAGSSYIIMAGPVGLMLYAYHRFPFKEVIFVFLMGILFYFYYYICAYVNVSNDGYIFGYFRSQIAWFFSAYLCITLMFLAHDKPNLETLAYYIVFAMFAQSVISVGMTLNESVKDFFFAIQSKADYNEMKMDMSEGQRIVGYGTGFFGAGAVYGFGLIFNAYLLVKAKLDRNRFILLAAVFCFIFYVGLFTARTTVTGLAIGLALIGTLYFIDSHTDKKRIRTFLIVVVFLAASGYSLSYIYFPSMTDWAFELFENFIETGELHTKSSNDISGMFYAPKDWQTQIFGTANMGITGSDVGYTILLFFVGFPGTILFFLYQLTPIWLSQTKDWTVNILGLALFLQLLVLNIKGFIDMSFIGFLYFFFFMFYKYYIYQPKAYMIKKEKWIQYQRQQQIAQQK